MKLLVRLWVASTIALLLLAGCVDGPTEHRVRANAFFRGGDYASALKECDEGLRQRPDDIGTLILRGKTLFELDRSAEAKGDFDRAIELSRGKGRIYLGDAYLGLAIIASRNRDWPGARDAFEQLLALDPHDASTHTNLARVYLELGDLPKAEEHASFAASVRPDDEATLFVLGRVYLASGKLPEATAAFSKIAESNARAPSAPYGLAMVAARQGDKAAALDKLRAAVALKVPNPGEIASDPAFASLRDDPEFVQIVQQATK